MTCRGLAGRREDAWRRRPCFAATFSAAFGVTVKSGIVTITGRAATRAVALDLLEAVRHVEGVVGMRDRVDYPPEEAPAAAGF